MAPRLRISNVWLNSAETTGISYQGTDNVARILGNAMSVPVGTNANRPTAANGIIRFNVDQTELERVKDGIWQKIAINSAVENAQSLAVTAFGQANLVFGQSNTAYSQGNVALGQANIVFAQANAAYSQANLVYGQANLKANIESPSFTGGPTCNTAANTTSNTMLATTQFVQNEFGRRLGKQSIWVPAAAMYPQSGQGVTLTEGALGSAYMQYLPLDPNSFEYCRFTISMPKGWDEGQISFKVFWAHPATTTNFSVVWQLEAVAHGDNEILTNNYNAASVTDTGGTTHNLYISAESSSFTIGNSPVEGDNVRFTFFRNASSGSDTLAVDAYLIGIMIYYTTNAWNDS